MGARHFTAAIRILAEAEQLDPSNPELISLFQAAKSGQGQEQRRRTIEELQNEIAIAVTRDEVARALAMVNEGLSRLPNDPALLQFKGQLERQTDEHDTRLVDETVQQCRTLLETSPREALQMVQERLRMFPGNERLERTIQLAGTRLSGKVLRLRTLAIGWRVLAMVERSTFFKTALV